jgi:Spy/CpxP family protein refolding chaperone
LNEEQITKLEKLRSDFVRRMIGERAALRTLRFDIRQALKADKMDLPAAEKLVRGAAKKRADIALDRIRTIKKGKALLTKEQIKELKTLISRRDRGRYGAMMREHHGMMEKEHHGPSGKSGSGKAEPGKGKKFLRGNIGRN